MRSWDHHHLSNGITQYTCHPTEVILTLLPQRIAGTHLSTPEGWKAELTWAPWVNSWLRTVTRRYHRCQLFNRHASLASMCERLAWGRYLAATPVSRPRLEPATFRLLIRRSSHYSTRPHNNSIIIILLYFGNILCRSALRSVTGGIKFHPVRSSVRACVRPCVPRPITRYLEK